MLRGICEPKRDEVTGEWRKLHNDEFHFIYSSTSIVWIIKLRRMRWAALWGRVEVYTGFWWRNLRERDHMEDTGVDGRIIFRKWVVGVWTGSICLKIWTDGGNL